MQLKLSNFPVSLKLFSILGLGVIIIPSEILAKRIQNYVTSWVGNSFGYNVNFFESYHVQNHVHEMDVEPDGDVWCASGWDEGGRCTGIYRGTDGSAWKTVIHPPDATGLGTHASAVAVDETYAYVCDASITRRYRQPPSTDKTQSWNGYTDLTFNTGECYGLAVSADKLYAAEKKGAISIWNKSNGAKIGGFSCPGVGHIAVDKTGSIWAVVGTQVRKYSETGEQKAVIACERPADVSIANDGRLMICDNGPSRRQVLFYDISGAEPVLKGTFGKEKGHVGGVPGLVLDEPLKFWDMVGASTDAQGNIYICMSMGYCNVPPNMTDGDPGLGDGTVIRKFKPDGTLIWDVYGMHFMDCVDVDPASDGLDIYGDEEHYVMDFTQPPGKQWRLKGYTVDVNKTPNDFRIIGNGKTTCGFIRRVQGKLMMYVVGQQGGGPLVYTWDEGNGEIATFRYEFNKDRKYDVWAIYPDHEGGIWSVKDDKIYRTPQKGFDANGAPIYGEPEVWQRPGGFSEITRIEYVSEEDALYLAGYSGFTPFTWGLIGNVVVKYDGWRKGERKESKRFSIPIKDGNVIQMHGPKAMAVAGDYLFVTYVLRGSDDGDDLAYLNPTKVWNVRTGVYEGEMLPGTIGSIGWIDHAYGLRAFKRSNGQYLIFQEDDGFAKVVMYQWCPSGECKESVTGVDEQKTIRQKNSANVLDKSAPYKITDIRGRVTPIKTLSNNKTKFGVSCAGIYIVKSTNGFIYPSVRLAR